MHKVGKGTVITQGLFFYPDLSDTGQYRGTFNFGTVTKLNKWHFRLRLLQLGLAEFHNRAQAGGGVTRLRQSPRQGLPA